MAKVLVQGAFLLVQAEDQGLDVHRRTKDTITPGKILYLLFLKFSAFL